MNAITLAPPSAPVLDEAGPPIAAGHCPFEEAIGTIRAVPVPVSSAPAASTFVALSKFVVANDKVAEVKAAFRQRPHLVDDQPGFVRMEVFSPLDRPAEIWLITYWTQETSFREWHHSHLYHESHRGIPKGLKLVPGETEIRSFEHVAS
jgi:heme-degrading monooxygenase HmoA